MNGKVIVTAVNKAVVVVVVVGGGGGGGCGMESIALKAWQIKEWFPRRCELECFHWGKGAMAVHAHTLTHTHTHTRTLTHTKKHTTACMSAW